MVYLMIIIVVYFSITIYNQIKVALEMRDTQPLVFTDSQRTDDFLEIELGSEDVLSQLDSIMQGNAERRNRL